MVFVFNFGGVPSPLIKRETKEPKSFSGNTHEMKLIVKERALW